MSESTINNGATPDAEAPEELGEAIEPAAEDEPAGETAPEETAERFEAEDAVEDGGGDPLAAAEAEIADLKDKLLRAMAETENVRRRAQREVAEARKFAVSDFARDLLTIADNLQRALAAIPDDVNGDNAALAGLLEGVHMTEKMLLGVLGKHAIERVDPMGEKLDPNLHQTVMQVEDADAEAGTVVEVLQIGYTLHGRLLRPAMVAVAKGGNGDGKEEAVDTSA